MGLSKHQLAVSAEFFSLPESEGFVLVGGAGLLATGVSSRQTSDLDYVTSNRAADLQLLLELFRSRLESQGGTLHIVQVSESFCRAIVSVEEEVVLDLALDSPPILEPIVTIAGPCLAPEELVARKLTALYARAEARDFVDIYVASTRFNFESILALAESIDAGLTRPRLSEAFGALSRFTDRELPIEADRVMSLRGFFRRWRARLDTPG